jgi:hypothetical protein
MFYICTEVLNKSVTHTQMLVTEHSLQYWATLCNE